MESIGTKMLTSRLHCLGSGAGGSVSLRHQVTFTVSRSAEALLLSPKRKWQKQQGSFHKPALCRLWMGRCGERSLPHTIPGRRNGESVPGEREMRIS